jgi:hypothetical protein
LHYKSQLLAAADDTRKWAQHKVARLPLPMRNKAGFN